MARTSRTAEAAAAAPAPARAKRTAKQPAADKPKRPQGRPRMYSERASTMSYTVPASLADRLVMAARAKGMTASALLCQLIDKHVKVPTTTP